MTARHATRAISITIVIYLAVVAALILLDVSKESAFFLGGSTTLMALALMMLVRGVMEKMRDADGLRKGSLFRLITDPFLVLTPGAISDAAKAFLASVILYVTKILVFGDLTLGVPPVWFSLMGGA